MSWRLDEDWRARLARWPAERFGADGTARLGRRLSVLAFAVPEGTRTVADIGADHGQLGAALLRTNRVERVVAIDRSANALEGAERALAWWIPKGRAEVRLGDGLAPLGSGGADACVLAGLGGAAIAGILGRAAELGIAPPLLVVQPLTGHHLVRTALAACGYRTSDERLDLDGDRIVSTLVAQHAAGAVEPPADVALWIGRGPLERAARSERDAEHLAAWCAVQKAWLAASPEAASADPRMQGVAEALARVESEGVPDEGAKDHGPLDEAP